VVRVGRADDLRSRLRQHLYGPSSFADLVFYALAYQHNQTDLYPQLKTTITQIKDPALQTAMKVFERSTFLPYMREKMSFTFVLTEEELAPKLELWATVLLSNYWRTANNAIDPPSQNWLGNALREMPNPPQGDADYKKIPRSGQWAMDLVDLSLTDNLENELCRVMATLNT
jgi:hypothetical protein